MSITSAGGAQRNLWNTFHMQVNPPEIQIHQEPAQLDIHQEGPELFINQTRSFAEKGALPSSELSATLAREGQSQVQSGIERRVIEGNQLGKIENRGISMAQILSRWDPVYNDFTVDLVPKTPPEIKVVTHPVDIRITLGYVDVTLNYGSIRVDVDPIINVTA